MNLEMLREFFFYDSTAGAIVLLKKLGRSLPGQDAVRHLPSGHGVVYLRPGSISARKVAWALHYGYMPTKEVLAISGDPRELRIDHLVLSGNVTVSQRLVRLLYVYSDGQMLHRHKNKGGAQAHSPAGSLTNGGYLETTVLGTRQLIHRIVWLYHHGVMPNLTDHINGIRTDNRIENLRDATYLTNAQNTRRKGARVYPTGVDRPGRMTATGAPYRTRVKDGGKVLISYHDTVDAASTHYVAEKRRICGEFSPI